MGREIRRVLPNWEHPREPCGHIPNARHAEDMVNGCCYIPLYDGREFFDHLDRWVTDARGYVEGTAEPATPRYLAAIAAHKAEHGQMRNEGLVDWMFTPPNPKRYTPIVTEAEATWVQCYENVTEGTPVSPPFEDPEDLIDWLASSRSWGFGGDADPGPREDVARFVYAGFAPTVVVVGGEVMPGTKIHARGGVE